MSRHPSLTPLEVLRIMPSFSRHISTSTEHGTDYQRGVPVVDFDENVKIRVGRESQATANAFVLFLWILRY